MKKQEKRNIIWDSIKEHIEQNIKKYVIVSIFFLIGIIAGVIFVNYAQEEIHNQIGNTITTFLDCLKTGYQIDSMSLLQSSIGNHIIFAFILWFMGSTIIGIPIVYGMITFRGFSLGYTVSSLLFALGTGKGILFCVLYLLLPNLLIIPAILALAVSGIRLYQAIMKDKRRENIKIEIIRHTIFSLFMTLILILSSLLEVYIANPLIQICISWF